MYSRLSQLNVQKKHGHMSTKNLHSNSSQIFYRFASNSNSLLSMLSGQSTPEDKAMLKSMEAAYMIIGNLLDKMDQKQGRFYRKFHSFSNV